MTAVYTEAVVPPPPSRTEVLRYAKISEEISTLSSLLDECLLEAERVLSPRVCYARFPLSVLSERVDIGFAVCESKSLARHLSGCAEVLVLAATVGAGLDRLCAKYSLLSPTKAYLLQAVGSERIEAVCDSFEEKMRIELEGQGKSLRTRFSPGYGDVPLSLQKDLFRALDCPRRIGLTLTEGLLMSPIKSVTALIGIETQP